MTYSVDPGNEGSQRSTSVPSKEEALRNVVYVDPIIRPHYEPINMTTAGLRRSKRLKSEKNKCYSTIKNIGFTAYCAFATMTTSVRGKISTISESSSEIVDPIIRPHYEPINMTTAGLRRSKSRKSEKNKCYPTINVYSIYSLEACDSAVRSPSFSANLWSKVDLVGNV